MTKEELYAYLRTQALAVVSSCDQHGHPQSALVGFAVSPTLELIFDTSDSSRKYANLIADGRVAVVIGWDQETSVQYEGIATLLAPGQHPLKEIYFAAYPDGRDRAASWPGLVHFKISPRWIRYSDFSRGDLVQEWNEAALKGQDQNLEGS